MGCSGDGAVESYVFFVGFYVFCGSPGTYITKVPKPTYVGSVYPVRTLSLMCSSLGFTCSVVAPVHTYPKYRRLTTLAQYPSYVHLRSTEAYPCRFSTPRTYISKVPKRTYGCPVRHIHKRMGTTVVLIDGSPPGVPDRTTGDRYGHL